MTRLSRSLEIIFTIIVTPLAGAQILDEPPAPPPVDHSAISREDDPAARMAAQQSLLGSYQTDDFKLNAISELQRKQQLYANLMPGATPPSGTPVWTSIGPTRDRFITNYVTLTKVVDSGRIASILPHPTNPNIVYVLSSGGGLWKTTQFTYNNAQWIPLTDALRTSGGAVALGHDPDTIYLGFGDVFDLALFGGVMAKSTDGGASWLSFTNLPGALAVLDVKVDTSGAMDVVLVATDAGLFRSADGGATYSLTLPNRAVWSLAQTSQGWIASTQPLPRDVVGAFVSIGAGPGVLYRSTDLGATWSVISTAPTGNMVMDTGAGRMTLAVATPGEAVVYAFAGSPQGFRQDNLYRSSDGGLTWTALGVNGSKMPLNPNCQQTSLNLMGFQAWYNQAIVLDPTDPQRNTVYIGGQNSSAKTTDGGATWRLTSIWFPGLCPDGSDAMPYVHADFHAAAMTTSLGTSTLIFGTDGGLAISNDAGVSFSTETNRGLVTSLSQTVVSSTKIPFSVLTGTQDDGSRLRVGGYSGVWNQVTGGDGEGVGLSQANNAVAITSFPGYFFLRYDNLPANPQPRVWEFASNGIDGLDYYWFQTSLATPRATADSSGLTFFTSTGSKVYHTIDGAKQWQPIFAATNLWGYPVRVFNPGWHVIGVHPTDKQRIAVAGTYGRVFITTDGGSTWEVSQARSVSNQYPGINVSPTWAANGTLYIGSAYAGFGRPRVAKSLDGGTTWSAAANGLPDSPLDQILADPRDATGNVVYAANWFGVYKTADGGASWTLLGAGLPNVIVSGLFLSDDGVLRAATYGRGIWQIQL